MSYYTSTTVHKNDRHLPSSSTPKHQQQSTPSRFGHQNVWIRTSEPKASLARRSMMMRSLPAYLVYYSENGAEQRFDITKSVMTIGRRDNNDIVLQCPLISKDHASIEKDDHGYFIRDHNSVNGIQVNEHRINVAAYLNDADEIQIGDVTLKFFDEVKFDDSNWKDMMQNYPALAAVADNAIAPAGTEEGVVDLPDMNLLNMTEADIELNANRPIPRLQATSPGYQQITKNDKHISLVTILPSEPIYEDSITVHAEIDGSADDEDFMPADNITDGDTLKGDYEKLRLAYELSKIGLTNISDLLEKTLDLMFSVLPVDRGVVLLVDRATGMLTTDKVKLREGKGIEFKEILLSQTILMKVLTTKRCLITIDALEDPRLGKTESIARGGIRSVICVPLVSRNEVHGILHFDSQDRINAFAEKDLALVKAIANQTAIALENMKLVKDVKKEVTIRENLGRFLPPHVVEKIITKGEEPVRKGGRHTVGTILFADIRGFTRLSERSSPQEVVDMLNEFFEHLVNIVFKHDGVLDKYIGDCLMAAFGTLPGQDENAELKAVAAALEFKTALDKINRERSRNDKEPITIGVGLNTGGLVAGYIGSSQRLEYTCIGDTVNTASRICSMASHNQVLVSQDTYDRIKDHIEANYVGGKVFKGKTSEVKVYEVLSIIQDTHL